MQDKPTVFIGSSSEGEDVAAELAKELRDVAHVRLWSHVFDLGDAAVETLFHELDRCDFAVLVATPDDRLRSRGKQASVPRDNVVFEAGLFMGRLGRKRAFVFSDSRVRLPSDLAGVTVARFESTRPKSMTSAVRKVVSALCHHGRIDEVGFLTAYLRLIDPDHIGLSDTYADILTHHYDSLKYELKQLRTSEDWPRLLKLKQRLREYFEYSGMNLEGVAFGRAYVKALRSLSREDEAQWSQVKDVGYMSILSGSYASGRKAINSAIKAVSKHHFPSSDSRKGEILFYAYRYLAISFHRDKATEGLKDAWRCLELAKVQLEQIDDDALHEELQAKLARNVGHLELEEGNVEKAIVQYSESLGYFESQPEPDLEHVGISHLYLAKALITQMNKLENGPRTHLHAAEKAFSRIGWIEGHARVFEQRARYFGRLAELTGDRDRAIDYLQDAWTAADNSQLLFDRIRSRRFAERLEPIRDELHRIAQRVKRKRRRTMR